MLLCVPSIPNLIVKSCSQIRLKFSTSVSQKTIKQRLKELIEEFSQPKHTLEHVINEAYGILNTSDIKPKVTAAQVTLGDCQKVWHVSISMSWPEKFEAEGFATRKSEAEKFAYLFACEKMKDFGLLSDENKLDPLHQVFNLHCRYTKNAKAELSNIFQVIWAKFGNREFIPTFETQQVSGLFGNSAIWKSKLTLKYPEYRLFEGQSTHLANAERFAAAKAMHWLFEKGIINQKKQPIMYSKEEQRRMLHDQKSPYPLFIPVGLQIKMQEVLRKFNVFDELHRNQSTVSFSELSLYKSDESPYEFLKQCHLIKTVAEKPQDIFSEKPCFELSEAAAAAKNRQMAYQQFLLDQRFKDGNVFPISKKKREILELLDRNQVVVISGETGCGKTTQVPQYILENFILQHKGSECNIVVTQPRRISAISIAEYVAAQRGENIGMSVGHQVRLNKVLPCGKGAILFCSTGILLKKLCYNSSLEGVSHVIIDEVHERSVQIDFLLILMKSLLEKNKKINLILMSASFDTKLLSNYFGNCPVIHVPGHIYPVKTYFLEDISEIVGCYDSKDFVKHYHNLVVKIIRHIDATQTSGAILCFLPGWNDIKSVFAMLPESFSDMHRYMICLLHSRLTAEEQKQVFIRPPDGVRKIILATNIAETSITIDDVVYVVDTGLHKETSFDTDKGTASLGIQWISKANVYQRRGRAGRVQPGVCYHLFPKKIFLEMEEYPMPEMLKMSLEKVVLDCKLYCPDVKAEDFLSLALQPPSGLSIHLGVQELQCLGILDQCEKLTALGKKVVNLSTHPRLSKALVVSTFLRCLDPVLTICAFFTLNHDPFCGALQNKSRIKEIKMKYDTLRSSDHLALYYMFCQWNSIDDEASRSEFCKDNLLDDDAMKTIKQLKSLFALNLFEAELIDSCNTVLDLDNFYNQNSQRVSLILSALTSAFYPNVIKLTHGEVSRGRLRKDVIIYSTLSGQKAFIQNESIAAKEYYLSSPWLVYFSSLKSEARRLLMIPAVSSVPGACLLLFSGQKLHISDQSKTEAETSDEIMALIDQSDKLNFSACRNDVQVLCEWRHILDVVFKMYLEWQTEKTTKNVQEIFELFYNSVLPLTDELFKTPHASFAPGKKYESLIFETYDSVPQRSKI